MASNRLIILTAFSGNKVTLVKTINSIINQLDKNDLWIIVLDNQPVKEYQYLKKKFNQLIFLENNGKQGAGISRNKGLDFIIKKIKGKFLLLPFDGDDKLSKSGVKLIKRKMKKTTCNLVSFAHQKIWSDGKKRLISYSGFFNIEDLLTKYITPCGSTVLKIKDAAILKNFRFGSRFRANDVLFFLQAVKFFGKFECSPNVLLNYYIGNKNSLSSKKYKMVFYKFLAFKDFGLSNHISIKYVFFYIFFGIKRYLFKLPI